MLTEIVYQIVKKISEWKGDSRSKVKSVGQEERLQKWKEHFKNLLGNPAEIIGKPTEEVIYLNF